MAKHDQHRVVAVLGVLGHPIPIGGRELTKPLHEPGSVIDVPAQRVVEVHGQQEVVRVALSRIVRRDDGLRRGQELLEPIEEESMNDCQMAGVFVSRPFA